MYNTKTLLNGEEILKVGSDKNVGISTASAEFNLSEIQLDLQAGLNTLTFQSKKASSNKQIYMWWDYIRIADTPSVNVLEISGTEKIYTEAENYGNVRILNSNEEYVKTVTFGTERIAADAAAHGGQIYRPYANDYDIAEIDVFVNVTEAGWYNVEFSAMVPGVYTISNPQLRLNGEEILKVGTENNTGVTAPSTTLNKSSVLVELSAGINKFTYRGYNAVSNNQLLIFWDYLAFEKYIPEEGATVENNVATVSANVTTPGTAIIALYGANGTMVGYGAYDVAEAGMLVNKKITLTGAAVSCKLFVWDNFTNVEPKAQPTVITIG